LFFPGERSEPKIFPRCGELPFAALGFGHSEVDSGGGSERRRRHHPGLDGEIPELGGFRLHFAPQFAHNILA
jgi:hypothetical protein